MPMRPLYFTVAYSDMLMTDGLGLEVAMALLAAELELGLELASASGLGGLIGGA